MKLEIPLTKINSGIASHPRSFVGGGGVMTDRLTGVSARLVSERKLFICNQINTLPASKSYQGQIIQRHE